MNLFEYVANSPTNWVDPWGLKLGVPPPETGYKPPKNWNRKKVKNPNGPGSGYPAKDGKVWVPTDHKGTHGEHWDVQDPKTGTHTPVYPPNPGQQMTPNPTPSPPQTNPNQQTPVPGTGGGGLQGHWELKKEVICGVVIWYLIWVAPYTPIPDPY